MEPVVPAAERGATRIAEQVIAKLAIQAAKEALVTAAAPAPAASPRRGGWPQATAMLRRPPNADGTGGLASIRVAVELGYPSDIGAQCRAVRRQISRRIKELADMDTADVTVDVERLRSTHFDGRGAGSGRVR